MEEILCSQFVCLSTGQDKVMSSGPEIVACFLDWRKKTRENMFERIDSNKTSSFLSHCCRNDGRSGDVNDDLIVFRIKESSLPISSSLANPYHA